ncbi:MAG: hypothetical protein ACOX1X_03675 [Dethiobacteria bacterium]
MDVLAVLDGCLNDEKGFLFEPMSSSRFPHLFIWHTFLLHIFWAWKLPESTAYAFLNEPGDSAPLFSWILGHRGIYGSFRVRV